MDKTGNRKSKSCHALTHDLRESRESRIVLIISHLPHLGDTSHESAHTQDRSDEPTHSHQDDHNRQHDREQQQDDLKLAHLSFAPHDDSQIVRHSHS
jgi:hypothetical protein